MRVQFILMVGLLAATALAAGAQAAVPPPPPPRTLAVTGTAEMMVPPNVGLAVVAIQTQADTVGRAVEQNNATATRIMQAIRGLNITGMTLRTLGFDVQPVYEQPVPNRPPSTRPPRIVGYQVTNRLETRLVDENDTRLSANIGRVLDAALTAGANRVDQVSFTLQNPQAALREALAAATREARETAVAMAAAAGVQLGPLMTLSATPYFQPPMPMLARAADAEGVGGGVPISAGPLTVRATVNAVYEIR